MVGITCYSGKIRVVIVFLDGGRFLPPLLSVPGIQLYWLLEWF